MVIIASGIACGRIGTAAVVTTTMTESCNMVVKLQINRLTETCSLGLLCTSLILGTSMLSLIDTYQNKVSIDQYHVAISLALVYSSSRLHVF